MITVICVNPKNFNITKGKEYEILDEDDQRFTIRNDNDLVTRYYKNLFEIKEEEKPELTLDLILEGLSFNLNNSELIIDIPSHNIEENIKVNNYTANNQTSGCGISCGVVGKNSINSAYAQFKGQKKHFEKLYNELNKYSSDDDFNIEEELFLFVIKKVFNSIIRLDGKNKPFPKGQHLIISLKHNDFSKYVMDHLIEFYPVNSTIVNKNSGNVITTFIIDRNY